MMTKNATRRRARLAAFAALSLTATIALTACGGSDGDAGGKVTLRFATETAFGKKSAYGEMIDRFNKSNDHNIKVEMVEIPNDSYFQTVRTMFQGGNAPDIVWGSPGVGAGNALGVLAQGGQLLDLSHEQWASSSIPETAKDLFYLNDQLIGVPVDIAPVPEVVNATAYEKAGISYANTFDEVLQQCAAVKKAKLDALLGVAGAQAQNTGLMALELAATRVYRQDPQWNQERAAGKVTFADSEGWQQTLQAVLDLKEHGCFQNGAEGGSPETITPEFTAGKILGIFAPAGIAKDLASLAPDSDISLALMPGATEDDAYLFASPTNALAINARSKHVDAAKALLKYWMQPSTLNEFAKLSGNVSLETVLNGEPVSDRFKNVEPYLADPARNAPLPNLFWPNTDVYDALGVGIQGLLTGQATVDQVLKSMDAAWGS